MSPAARAVLADLLHPEPPPAWAALDRLMDAGAADPAGAAASLRAAAAEYLGAELGPRPDVADLLDEPTYETIDHLWELARMVVADVTHGVPARVALDYYRLFLKLLPDAWVAGVFAQVVAQALHAWDTLADRVLVVLDELDRELVEVRCG